MANDIPPLSAFQEDFLNQADPNDLRNVVLQQGQLIQSLWRSVLELESLSEISPDASGTEFRAVDEDGNLRLIVSAADIYDEFGIHAHFAGFDANLVPQFYLSADDGKGYFAGGAGIIDVNGITLRAEEYPSVTFLQWKADDNDALVGRAFATYGGIATDAGIILVGRAHDSSTAGFALLWAEDDTGDLKAGLNVTSRQTMYFTVGEELGDHDVVFIARKHSVSFAGMGSERMLAAETEMFDITPEALAPYVATAIGAGTVTSAANAAVNHPGVVIISQNGANTGYAIGLGNLSQRLFAGGEIFEIIFAPTNLTNVEQRFGFQDSVAAAAPVDGAWINISGTTLTGKTSNNSTPSTTATSLAVGSFWYRARITYDGTTMTFAVFDLNDTLLWTDTLTANIPTAAGRAFGVAAVAYKTTAGTVELVRLDWMSYRDNTIIRPGTL